MKNTAPRVGMLLAIVTALVFVIHVPYVLLTPGPVFNTLGTSDSVPVVGIAGAKTYPTKGSLNMTTVSEYGGPQDNVTLFQALWGWVSASTVVIPRDSIYSPTETQQGTQLQNAADFSTSQSNAIAAAMIHLNKPYTSEFAVTSVDSNAPATGLLRAGDRLLEVDGDKVTSDIQVVRAVRDKPIGTKIHFKVNRNGVVKVITVKSGPRPDLPATTDDESKMAYVGIMIGELYSATFPITFGLQNVGGPSAGTMFALAIVDKLTPGPLTGGHMIAGTGTISEKGEVGAIGGIRQKMIGARRAGATLFLAPTKNCDEVVGHVPDGLTVVPVKTLDEAVSAIEGYNSGKQLEACSAVLTD